ncbi:hypothetical protein NDU88_004168 [Pleurodeles waltl]|uniref:Uncharacterized protein n=1 Tax=Pleurodeles waltl TaxID=8319 RepID=A0AAV7L5X8_PLEWA|nr:hypothetical protein NDU88_004168 [Pleurodeles waltl]
MEPLNQSPGGRTKRSAPRSIYDFRVAEIKQEDTGEEAKGGRTKSRREASRAKEETRSRRSGDKENERSQSSKDDEEGRSEESLEGENRVRSSGAPNPGEKRRQKTGYPQRGAKDEEQLIT